jgi:hypothetical protein
MGNMINGMTLLWPTRCLGAMIIGKEVSYDENQGVRN